MKGIRLEVGFSDPEVQKLEVQKSDSGKQKAEDQERTKAGSWVF